LDSAAHEYSSRALVQVSRRAASVSGTLSAPTSPRPLVGVPVVAWDLDLGSFRSTHDPFLYTVDEVRRAYCAKDDDFAL